MSPQVKLGPAEALPNGKATYAAGEGVAAFVERRAPKFLGC